MIYEKPTIYKIGNELEKFPWIDISNEVTTKYPNYERLKKFFYNKDAKFIYFRLTYNDGVLNRSLAPDASYDTYYDEGQTTLFSLPNRFEVILGEGSGVPYKNVGTAIYVPACLGSWYYSNQSNFFAFQASNITSSSVTIKSFSLYGTIPVKEL